jgi:DNA-binding response OmpR family regulator
MQEDKAELPAGPPGSRVLLVEDHADSAEAMIAVMKGARCDVRWVETAAAALDAFVRDSDPAASSDPDLILLDLTLPDKSGVELVHELRRTYRSLPPIVVISAKPSHALKDDARAIQAAGILRKPFGMEELLKVLGAVPSRG